MKSAHDILYVQVLSSQVPVDLGPVLQRGRLVIVYCCLQSATLCDLQTSEALGHLLLQIF